MQQIGEEVGALVGVPRRPERLGHVDLHEAARDGDEVHVSPCASVRRTVFGCRMRPTCIFGRRRMRKGGRKAPLEPSRVSGGVAEGDPHQQLDDGRRAIRGVEQRFGESKKVYIAPESGR